MLNISQLIFGFKLEWSMEADFNTEDFHRIVVNI